MASIKSIYQTKLGGFMMAIKKKTAKKKTAKKKAAKKKVAKKVDEDTAAEETF